MSLCNSYIVIQPKMRFEECPGDQPPYLWPAWSPRDPDDLVLATVLGCKDCVADRILLLAHQVGVRIESL